MDKENYLNSNKFVVKGKKVNQIRSKILLVGVDMELLLQLQILNLLLMTMEVTWWTETMWISAAHSSALPRLSIKRYWKNMYKNIIS